MRFGVVALIGRPNAGKSTLLNNLIGQKVSITSPKPKTTRLPIKAVYEDERGQIIFVDTPGLFEKIAQEKVDLVVYLIDHTRYRGGEENKTIGLVRKFKNIPKILVFNKIDIKKPSYKVQYKFLEEEFNKTLEISALFAKNLKLLLEAIFEFLPEGMPQVETGSLATPLLNMDSKTFIAELIREKVFLFTKEELPYKTSAVVDEIAKRENGTLFIKGRVITSKDKYRRMLIGKKGGKIKEIGSAARKELELATNKKVFLDLTVETVS